MHPSDLVAPLAGHWIRRRLDRPDGLPRPADASRQFVAGGSPDRVLVLGDGPALGAGVPSQELALPGRLARRLAERTGRGAVVDVLARPGLTAEAVPDLLTAARVARYDAIVLTLGAADAAGLLPVDRWRTRLATVLDRIRRLVPGSTAVLLVAARPVHRPAGGRLGALVTAHAERLDAASIGLAGACAGVRFLPAGAAAATAEGYDDLGARVAEALAPALDRAARANDPTSARSQRRGPDPEVLRQDAVDRSGLAGTGSSASLDRLLEEARDRLGVAGAALTLIDGEHATSKASVGVPPWAVDRAMSPCSRTIRRDGVHVIPVLDDAPDAEWRFYAGHPIESPDGFRIASLCVLDGEPRSAGDFDEQTLAEVAARVQTVLWAEIAERAGGTVPTA